MSQDLIFTGISKEDFFKEFRSIIKAEVADSLKNAKENDQTDLLTASEAAELLNVSKPTLDAWCKKGILVKYRIGARINFKRSEILAYLEENNLKSRFK